MILEGDVGLDLIAQRGDVRGRQYAPNRRLDVEIASSFAERHRRQVRPRAAGQRRYSGGCLDLKPCRDYMISPAFGASVDQGPDVPQVATVE
jgi:hypothetical protein